MWGRSAEIRLHKRECTSCRSPPPRCPLPPTLKLELSTHCFVLALWLHLQNPIHPRAAFKLLCILPRGYLIYRRSPNCLRQGLPLSLTLSGVGHNLCCLLLGSHQLLDSLALCCHFHPLTRSLQGVRARVRKKGESGCHVIRDYPWYGL